MPQAISQNTPLRSLPAWKALEEHADKIRNLHLRQLFADDPQRNQRFTVEALGFYLDYSKHRITEETVRLLIELAEQSGTIWLRRWRDGGCLDCRCNNCARRNWHGAEPLVTPSR